MKKIIALIIAFVTVFGLSGCAFFEIFDDNSNIVDLGDGESYVRWNLVENDNEYSTVESAYFEFNSESFKYYEDGVLKKEGTHRITYSGVENTIAPLHINLDFGKDESGLSIFDYLDCYTEDEKDNLSQFTIMRMGYHIDPPRSGGVPVRDYHLSDMPYAIGTYVRESAEKQHYENDKADYLGVSKLDGTFIDENGNKLYFVNNSYSSDAESVHYNIYMRYENNVDGNYIEGTIYLSYYNEFESGKHHDVALIYVMHGEGEPSEESGVTVEADYELMDFTLGEDGSISFAFAKYFDEASECDYDPGNFVGGTYYKVAED